MTVGKEQASVANTVKRLAQAAGLWQSKGPGWVVTPVEASAGRGEFCLWYRNDAGLENMNARYIDAATALLAVLCLTRTETLTSPALPTKAEAMAWARARALSGTVGPWLDFIGEHSAGAGKSGFVARVERPVAVKIGRCPACVARSWPAMRKLATHEWAVEQAAIGHEPLKVPKAWQPKGAGWIYGEVVWNGARAAELDVEGNPISAVVRADVDVRVCSRPCPSCYGTGDRWTEVGRLVRDAAPTCDGPGDPEARDALAVWSDRLQATPDPCDFCGGSGQAWAVDAIGPGVTPEQANASIATCMCCDGLGVDLDAKTLGERVALWLAGRNKWTENVESTNTRSC